MKNEEPGVESSGENAGIPMLESQFIDNDDSAKMPTVVDCDEAPIPRDFSCGIGCLHGSFLQKFANQYAFAFLYGVFACIVTATFSYFGGTLSTVEKRFQISSKTAGFIASGNNISQTLGSIILTYYAGKGHIPRWIAMGICAMVLFCIFSLAPHLVFGAGEQALRLARENAEASELSNTTTPWSDSQENNSLCLSKDHKTNNSATEDNNLTPQVLFFLGQLIAGCGTSILYPMGFVYMDNNVEKSKVPAFLAFSYFLRTLGPAVGFSLAAFTLNYYIHPSLTSTIPRSDKRWLGAWWMGWIILAILLSISACIVALFPKKLPTKQKSASPQCEVSNDSENSPSKLKIDEKKVSFNDMWQSFKRLLTEKTMICNTLAIIFSILSYMPYWIFLSKYIEIQYKKSASESSSYTGTVALVFNAVGVLLSGLLISKFKPRARYITAWSVLVALICLASTISFTFLGCDAADNQLKEISNYSCNSNCNCEFAAYNPVCGSNSESFISPCHAGCRKLQISQGKKNYSDCTCVEQTYSSLNQSSSPEFGTATSGFCPVDCKSSFQLFLVIVCIMQFCFASSKLSNLLISLRCVIIEDKPLAAGFQLMAMSLFAMVPAPILFGYINDRACLVWTIASTSRGNCWHYDTKYLRYLFNLTSAGFAAVGLVFEVLVWHFARDLQMYDDMPQEKKNSSPKESCSSNAT